MGIGGLVERKGRRKEKKRTKGIPLMYADETLIKERKEGW
jgi:hypothetical protein